MKDKGERGKVAKGEPSDSDDDTKSVRAHQKRQFVACFLSTAAQLRKSLDRVSRGILGQSAMGLVERSCVKQECLTLIVSLCTHWLEIS